MPLANRYNHMINHVRATTPERFLELGVLWGTTSLDILSASPGTEHWGIDLFEDYLKYFDEVSSPQQQGYTLEEVQGHKPLSLAEVQIKLSGFNSHLIKSRTQDVDITTLPKFDCIWIDAGHSYASVKHDFEKFSQLLVPSGVIFIDDYTPEPMFWGIKKFVDELTGWHVEILGEPMDHYRGYDFQTVKVTCA